MEKQKKGAARRHAIVEAIRRNELATGRSDSMISRLTVRNVATFDSEGVTLDGLQRVNFIYGRNGVGKTTLSRVLEAVNESVNRSEIIDKSYLVKGTGKYRDCEVEWTGIPLKVLVYNRDFRERNLVENIPGVFTLGEDSVDAEKRMEELQIELLEQNRDLQTKKNRIESREKQITQDVERLRHTLWNDVLLPQSEYFSEILANENDRAVVTSREQFARLMMAMVENGRYKDALSRESLQERYRQLYRGERPLAMEPIEKPTDELTEMTGIAEKGIWGKSIGNGEVCPKCGQLIVTEETKKEKRDIEELRLLTERYEAAAERMKDKMYGMLTYLQTAQGSTGKHLGVMRMMVEILKDRMDANIQIMETKQKNATMVAQFKELKETTGSLWSLIDETNAEIAEHNKIVNHLEPERKRLTQDLLTYLAGRSASTVKYCLQTVAQKRAEMLILKEEAEEIDRNTEAIVEQIKAQEKRLASTKPTVEWINRQLKRYGFTGFSIQPTRNGNTYQIQREDGSLVKDTLSEGEVTFITFLYYMQLVNGGESDISAREKKVLVIDDPMSSLDRKALKMVIDVLKPTLEKVNKNENQNENENGNKNKRIESDINQVIVLTHNVEFHKKVTHLNARVRKRSGWHHWVLTKKRNVTHVTAFGEENPIRSGYEEEWIELRTGGKDTPPARNTMRSIIEDYFIRFGGYEKNQLIRKYSDDEGEQEEMREFFEWLDEGSHGTDDETYGEVSVGELDGCMELFKGLFVRLGHDNHYKMMMREESL